jgi:hypothetical protein
MNPNPLTKIRASMAIERKMRAIEQSTTFKGNPPGVAAFRQEKISQARLNTNLLRFALLSTEAFPSSAQAIQRITSGVDKEKSYRLCM